MTTEPTAPAPAPVSVPRPSHTRVYALIVLVAVLFVATLGVFWYMSRTADVAETVSFRVIENGLPFWYDLSGNGKTISESVAPEWFVDVSAEQLREGDFSAVTAENGSVVMLSTEGLDTTNTNSERSSLIVRSGLETSSSAVGADASLAVLYNGATDQFDVFSLDSVRPTVLSYEGSVDAPDLFYGVGALPGNRIAILTTPTSFDLYHVKGGTVSSLGSVTVAGAAPQETSLFSIPTAHAWTYGTPLTSTGATTAGSTSCTGAVVASLGGASGEGTMPSIQTMAWNYMGAQGSLPANYNSGSYCIQALTTVTFTPGGGQEAFKTESFRDAFSSLLIPVTQAAGGGGTGTYTWDIVFTIHSGSGTAAAGQRYTALTYAAPAGPPTVNLTASPATVDQGASSALTWNSTNATSCTGTGFSTGGATSGTVSVTPASTATYSISCTGTNGTASNSTTVTVVNRPNLVSSGITPLSANVLGQTTVSTTITNNGAADTGASFYVHFQLAQTSSGTNVTTMGTGNPGALASGASATASVTHDFTSTGTWYIRACADKANASDVGSITESNESDNCTAWTAVSVTGSGQGTWQHTASDIQDFACPLTDMTRGGHLDQADCSPTNPTGNACNAVGDTCKYKYPSGCNMYIETYECVSTTPTPTVTAELTANPLSLPLGSATALTWSSTNATSCVGTGFATGGATSGSVTESPTSTTQYIISCTASSGTSASGSWEGDSWWTGGTQVAVYGETIHDNGQQSNLCPDAAANAGYSAWNEEFVRYPNRCSDAGCDLAYITCYGVTGATGTTAKPAVYNGGVCTSSTAWGCRDTTYRRSSETASQGTGIATDSETVTVTVTECSDGISNDTDGLIDLNDPGCTDTTDTSESPNPVTATLTAPASVPYNTTATLTWTCTNSTSATLSTFGSVSPVSGGSRVTGALTANSNYTLTCSGPDGTANDSEAIAVTNPVAYIEATPERVNAGSTTVLGYSATGLTPSSSCTVSGPSGTLWTGASNASGVLATTTSTSPAITTQSIFRISCDGASATDNVIVNVVPAFEEF